MNRHRIDMMVVTILMMAVVVAPFVWSDGGYFSKSSSVAVSTDQRAVIIKNGDEISMTFSTGYSGDGDDFVWVIPTPAAVTLEDVREAGGGETAFVLLDQHTAPTVIVLPGKGFFGHTEVLTAGGARAIDEVEAGTGVYAWDPAAGAWTIRTVTQVGRHHYEGDLITIRAGAAEVEATGNQPFFVLRGDRLDARPVPDDVPLEDLGLSEQGRWVKARYLQAGDALAARHNQDLVVTGVSRRHEVTDVYNLAVDELRTYAIHPSGIVVHNMPVHEEQPVVGTHTALAVDRYEVSILKAASTPSPLEWLRNNGYAVSTDADAVLSSYIRDNCAFVVVRTVPDERGLNQNEFLPPLTIRYRGDRAVYPLRMSTVSTVDPVRITLFVIADSTASSANLPTAPLVLRETIGRSADRERFLLDSLRQAVGSDGRGMAVAWKGEYPQSLGFEMLIEDLTGTPSPEDARFFLTRLEAYMDPSMMTDDVELVLDSVPRWFERVTLNSSSSVWWAANSRPRQLRGLSRVSVVTAGGGAEANTPMAVVAAGGTVWTWKAPQAGVGDLGEPMQVKGLSDVVAVSAGGMHTVALQRDGTVWTWGDNGRSQLGDGIPAEEWGAGMGAGPSRSAPGPVPGLSSVVAIAVGGSHSVALKDDGTVWAWGWNPYGQLGDGSGENRATPVRVKGIAGAVAVGAGGGYSLAAKSDGSLWVWGCTRYARDVDRSATDCTLPTEVQGISGVTAIAPYANMVLKSDGTVWALSCSAESAGGPYRFMAERVAGFSGIVAIDSNMALKADGTVWVCGSNEYGELGDDSRAGSYRPLRIEGLSEVIAIASGGGYRLALKSDGTVWVWGKYW